MHNQEKELRLSRAKNKISPTYGLLIPLFDFSK